MGSVPDAEGQQRARLTKMARYDSMPPEIQALSREYGKMADDLYAMGLNEREIKENIRSILKDMERHGRSW